MALQGVRTAFRAYTGIGRLPWQGTVGWLGSAAPCSSGVLSVSPRQLHTARPAWHYCSRAEATAKRRARIARKEWSDPGYVSARASCSCLL